MGFEQNLNNPSRDEILRAFGVDPDRFRKFEETGGYATQEPGPDLREAVQQYLGQWTDSDGALATYRYLLGRFTEHMEELWRGAPGEAHTVDKILSNDIASFVFRAKVGGGSLAPSSTNRDLAIIRSFFRWLFEEEHLLRNPALKVKRQSEPLGAPVALSEEEQQRLLDLGRRTVNGIKNHTIITLTLNTGLRAREVSQLTWSKIDFKHSWLYVRGKGQKDAAVPLLPTVVDCLQYYRHSVRQGQVAAPGCSDFVFLNERGTRWGKPMTVDGLEDMVGRLLMSMGKPKGCSFHVLRHCFGVNLLRQGVHLALISRLLRHENWETTRKYLRLGDPTVARELEKYFPEGVLVPETMRNISLTDLQQEVYSAFGVGR